MRTRLPSPAGHVVLLWRLRLAGALAARRGRLLGLFAWGLSATPALPLAAAGWGVMTWGPVASSPLWSRLAFDLLAFVTACVWVAWPILSAGVDDHSELRRYAVWPVTPARLLVASTAASLLEPLTLVILAPLLGATVGLLSGHPGASWAGAAALVAAFALFGAAWSRAGLHLVLNVLRRRRGAGAIGAFFLFVLAVSLVLPPVDVSWLSALGGAAGAVSPDFALQAAVGLSRVPTGWLGEGLRELSEGRPLGALLEGAGLLWFAAMGLLAAYDLLVRFHRRPARAAAGPRRWNPFARIQSRFGVLVLREALDLYRNPRARLLFFVPFLLTVALRLLSARQLALFALGPRADAWLMGGLALYGVMVFSLTFVQNAFGYDGHGLALVLAAPIDPGEVLRAKNLVHGTAAAGMAVLLVAFYRLYLGAGGAWEAAMALSGAAALLPAVLVMGNFTSVGFPTRYHASLERRDRPPRAATASGIGASVVGSAPFAVGVNHAQGGTSWTTVAGVLGIAALLWGLFRVLRPGAERALRQRRERVLRAVTRG